MGRRCSGQLLVLAGDLRRGAGLLLPHPEKNRFLLLLNALTGWEATHVNGSEGGKVISNAMYLLRRIAQRRSIRLLCLW